MKIDEILATVPVALGELHEAGRDEVYMNELGEQVTRHDEKYMKRRRLVRKALGRVGINISELPSGFLRPGPRIYIAIAQLEREGIIEGNFEERDDEKPRRRKYKLVATEELEKVDPIA